MRRRYISVAMMMLNLHVPFFVVVIIVVGCFILLIFHIFSLYYIFSHLNSINHRKILYI